MLSIGEFSKICKVSTKTLRYYEKIGLLYPAKINASSGYRYYTIDQMKQMLLIDRLKGYAFSLDEIKQLLIHSNGSQDRFINAMQHKKKELQEKSDRLLLTMDQMEQDITSMKQGKSMLSYLEDIEVELVEVETMYVLSDRRRMTKQDCDQGYGAIIYALYEKSQVLHLSVIKSPITIYHSTYEKDGYDMEFLLPVKEYATGTKDFSPGLCLKSKLYGSYDQITSIYARQREWMEVEGYTYADAPFDVYVTDPTQVEEKDFITEIYSPVKKR